MPTFTRIAIFRALQASHARNSASDEHRPLVRSASTETLETSPSLEATSPPPAYEALEFPPPPYSHRPLRYATFPGADRQRRHGSAQRDPVYIRFLRFDDYEAQRYALIDDGQSEYEAPDRPLVLACCGYVMEGDGGMECVRFGATVVSLTAIVAGLTFILIMSVMGLGI